MVKKKKYHYRLDGTYSLEPGLKVPHPVQCGMYGVKEARAAVESMDTDLYTLGPYTRKFQEEFARYIGVQHAFAVTNCANALELAAASIGIKPKDEVIVSSITFFSTTLGILRLGGKVVFADIDPRTYNITAETIEEKITPRTKAIYVVHMYGLPADMDPILKLARKHKLAVVEDCAHTPGAEYHGRKTGSMGDFGCFSFHSAKNMTTCGEGGMLTTSNYKAASEMALLRHVGTIPIKNQKRYWLPYLYDVVKVKGYVPYNFCMTELQAAVGSVQLKKLDKLNGVRRKMAERLNEEFSDIPELQLPYEPLGYKHVFHLYPVLFDGSEFGATRDDLIELLYCRYKIRPVPLYPPVYYFTIYKEMGYKKGLCPVAEKVYSRHFTLPFYPGFTDDTYDYMVDSVRKSIDELKEKKSRRR